MRKERPHNRVSLIPRRRFLRRNLTPAEATLWIYLKNSKLAGRKFRRQHRVGPYILDFYCDAERLAVELDGEVHFDEVAIVHDHRRKLYLNNIGIKVIRFENSLVFEDIDYLLASIQVYFGWWKNSSGLPPRG